MSIDFKALANPSIQNLTVYQPGKPVEEVERELGIKSSIKLASNENPFGASPKALSAAKAALAHCAIYPDGRCYKLKQALAETLQIKPAQITVGNGSENVLEIIAKAYLRPGNSAVISQYAFLTISLLIRASGAKEVVVPARNFGHDLDAMLAAVDETTRIVFIVNPNNPTGTYTKQAEFERFMRAIPPHVLVVVDEAYNDYITEADYPKSLSYLPHYPNLIITRTFSKAYGLAALRLGFGISSENIADMLNRARLPFNVNSIAAAAGCAALTDVEHLDFVREKTRQGLQQLEAGIKKLQINFIPSLANFITINMQQDGNSVYQQLLTKGVIVRPLGAYAMPTFLRVTVGTYEQNELFLKALSAIHKE